MKIGIVSAEPSGDLLGSKILSKIKEKFENIEVIGVGGGALTEHNVSTDREMLEIMVLVAPIPSVCSSSLPEVLYQLKTPPLNLGLRYVILCSSILSLPYGFTVLSQVYWSS